MSIQTIIEQFQHAVVQIATKTGTGTGFYLQDYDLIVTNNHVVRDNQRVTVKARSFEKKLAQVVFTDEKHDLAFLMPPVDMSSMQEIELGEYNTMKDGDSVVAIGHPYGLNYTATQGVISRVNRVQQGIRYIQIDAAINPGNSGGPLVDERGQVVGVNTFIIKGGDNLGFALPVSYLRDALEHYSLVYGEVAMRCPSCNATVTEDTLDGGKYCPNCGTDIDFPKADEPDEEPVSGIAKTIEDILEKLGFNKELARNGQNKWEVQEGSARIKINYNPDNYFIISDAFLCRLPKRGISELYTYLLKENMNLRCKLFSLQGENVVLSSLIYDLDISTDSAMSLFKDLFEKADYYDEYLMKEFHCQPILEEN
ncbi:MAG: trypsin-like serine protease [Sphingobacteriales bacterium]|nr:MAG: trypsin-like serine protease [Sphingobacteriales bacterium]